MSKKKEQDRHKTDTQAIRRQQHGTREQGRDGHFALRVDKQKQGVRTGLHRPVPVPAARFSPARCTHCIGFFASSAVDGVARRVSGGSCGSPGRCPWSASPSHPRLETAHRRPAPLNAPPLCLATCWMACFLRSFLVSGLGWTRFGTSRDPRLTVCFDFLLHLPTPASPCARFITCL